MGTSLCSTCTTSTTAGSGAFAPWELLEQPAEITRPIAISQVEIQNPSGRLKCFISALVTLPGITKPWM
jgi:hypothetical protein